VSKIISRPSSNGLADTLVQTWAQQGLDGFLLSDPKTAQIETSHSLDESCGVRFRFFVDAPPRDPR